MRLLRRVFTKKRLRIASWLVPLLLVTFIGGAVFDDLSSGWNISFTRRVSNSANKQLPENLDYSSVEHVYDLLRRNYDGELDQNQLLNGLKKGLAEAAGDEYTAYFDEAGAKLLEEQINGSFTGIGAELGLEDEQLIILAPLDGFPAQKAGLRPKDAITEINGESTVGLSVEEAVQKIRGEKGTVVKLTVVRSTSEQLNFEITRDTITIASVKYEVLDGSIGYLRISRFSEDTVQLAQKAATAFIDQGVKGVILDLRSNPGGYLDGSVDVAGLWLKNKVVVQERRGETVVKTYKSKNRAPLAGIKTVVLIDEGSASASEIVAGALHDHGAAQLVGAKTYGKGSVQELKELEQNTLLKITIARWYTPNGENIDEKGITPDLEVTISAEQLTAGTDPQKEKALELLR